MDYGFYATLNLPFADALRIVIDALKSEGFGVLSDIDIQKAMKDKLGVEVAPQRILGACNPPLAHKALVAEPNIGLLLPCNVTVREESENQVVVGFLNPEMMVEATRNSELRPVAADASARLHRVRDAIQALR